MSYQAPGRARTARLPRKSRAYRERKRNRDAFLSMAQLRATCRECQQPLDQVADCTCLVRSAPKPLRKSKIENPKSKIQ